jgi:hypothetical protein
MSRHAQIPRSGLVQTCLCRIRHKHVSWGGRPKRAKSYGSVLHAMSWQGPSGRPDTLTEGRKSPSVCIARNVIPRVKAPVCCVGVPIGTAFNPYCTQCLHAINGQFKSESERTPTPSGLNHPNPGFVHVSYRTFSHVRAFHPKWSCCLWRNHAKRCRGEFATWYSRSSTTCA